MLNILRGIAGSGKTDVCLRQYREVLQQNGNLGRLGETVWLSPTHRSVQQVLEQLPTAEFPCCFTPGVMTFEQFAERVLQGGGASASLLNPAERRMLVKSVIEEAKRAGELSYFAEVSTTRGFTNQVGRFIAELKRDETWPEQFRESLANRQTTAKDLELACLYERYQERMQAWNKYDPEGRFWLARTLLAKGHWEAFPRLKLVVVSGFTDFTRTQRDMLVLLGRHAEHLLITLPGESTEGREDLFAKSTGTVALLARQARARNLECRETFTAADAGVSPHAVGAGVIARSMFSNPRQHIPADNASGITCLTALGPRAEVREVARRVKQLLLRGVAARDILVTVRNLETYEILIDTLWTDAGIPHAIHSSRSIALLPLARALTALLDVMRQDWSFASLKKLLRHTPLKWTVRGPSTERARAVLQVLRQLNLQGGRQEILDTLGSLVTRLASRDDTTPELPEESVGGDRRSALFTQALETLQSLDQSLKLLSRAGSHVEQTQQLLAIARELFLSASEGSTTAVRDRPILTLEDQWDLLAGLLRESAAFQDRLAGDHASRVSWQAYADWLDDQFRFQSLPARKGKPGEVLVLDAGEARHLKTPYLFVLGLQEGSFPGRGDQQLFYSEQEREAWNEAGIPLAIRSAQHQEEMQFFHQLITRAQTELTLSFSHVSNSGSPQYPCAFLQALRSLFRTEALPEIAVGQLSPLPSAGDLLSESDCRLQAVTEMHEDRPNLLCWWGTRPARQRSFLSVLEAARMNSARFEQSGFTSYEGMLQLAANRRILQSRFHQEHTFSASRLEAYANCPFRFMLDHVLGIHPLEAPRLATDYSRRGNLVHDILAKLHGGGVFLGEPENQEAFKTNLTARFLELLTERSERRFTRSELQRTLDSLEQQLVAEWAELFAEQSQEYAGRLQGVWDQGPDSRFLEISFGSARGPAAEPGAATDEATGAPVLPAVRFGKGEYKILMEGRIDRIDTGRADGRDVFTIIDYKTGEPPTVKEQHISHGTQLQLALYAVAVARLKLVGPDALPWLIGYWGVREKGFQPQLVDKRKNVPQALSQEILNSWEETLDRLLPRMVQAIREGEFPVINEDQTCMSRCPYRTVCRVGQIRAVSERLQKNWSLQPDEESPANA